MRYKLKFEGKLDEKVLLGLGAVRLGEVEQEDIYIQAADHLIRIRKEGDAALITFRVKTRREGGVTVVEQEEHYEGEPVGEEIARVKKRRTIYVLGDVRIYLDDVEGLGEFTEIVCDGEGCKAKVYRMAEMLGLSPENALNRFYYELLQMKQRGFYKLVHLLHRFIVSFSYGIGSGTITVLGVMTGVAEAVFNKAAVLSSVLSVGLVDSFSDAFSLYFHETAKGRRGAIRTALYALISKLLFSLIYVPAIILLDLKTAVLANIALGFILLLTSNAVIAFMARRNVVAEVGKNVLIFILVLALAKVMGRLVNLIV